MRIIGNEAIAQRVNVTLPTDPAVLASWDDAIKGTTVFLSSLLETRLDTSTGVTDTFWVDQTQQCLGGLVRLRLANGFVKNVAVQVFDDEGNIVGTPVPTVKAEGGLVSLKKTDCAGKTVQVTYDCGFADEDAAIPDWLTEAACVYAVQLMHLNQLSEAKPDANPLMKFVTNHVGVIVANHLRNFPLAIKPL